MRRERRFPPGLHRNPAEKNVEAGIRRKDNKGNKGVGTGRLGRRRGVRRLRSFVAYCSPVNDLSGPGPRWRVVSSETPGKHPDSRRKSGIPGSEVGAPVSLFYIHDWFK